MRISPFFISHYTQILRSRWIKFFWDGCNSRAQSLELINREKCQFSFFYRTPIKKKQGGETIVHHACIITYVDIKKHKLISLLTNDKEFDPAEIIEIYRRRWEIELLFKQIKQNFPLRCFYVGSAMPLKSKFG